MATPPTRAASIGVPPWVPALKAGVPADGPAHDEIAAEVALITVEVARAAGADSAAGWGPVADRWTAADLFISESTAGVHVSNILGKLGVSGRAEAAAVAVRLGLDASVEAGERPA